MNHIEALLERCRNLGATLTPVADKLRVEAPNPLPDDILLELKQSKNQILAELSSQKSIKSIDPLDAEWRKISIPTWRRILKESIEVHDVGREKFAIRMLRNILEDPEYREEPK